MCGIFGIMNGKKRNIYADDFIKSGFVASSLRGMDSTGIASVSMDKAVFAYQKLPVMGSMFIQDKFALQLIRDAQDSNTLTIGHNRASTVGKIDINNAHPFSIETKDREFVGVHNGTLTNWKMFKSAADYDVDSEWALNHIFDKGDEAFADFNGAYTFAWWDSKEVNTLHIALNDQRPMHVALLEDGGMAFASEPGMLFWLLERHNIKIVSNLLTLLPQHHYKFTCDDVANFSKQAIKKYVYVAPAHVPSVPVSSYRGSKSTVEKVQDFMDSLKPKPVVPVTNDAVSTQVPTTPATSVFVSKEEQQSARDLGMMMLRGSFVPSWRDDQTGTLYGQFMDQDSDLEAVIRNCPDIEYGPTTMWAVSVVGLMDIDNNLTVVCSKPNFNVQLSLVPKTGKELTTVY